MSDTITIGGREFRVGATYAPKSGKGRKRIFVVAWEDLAEVEWRRLFGSQRQNNPRICSYRTWLRWAGDEVAP